jgi:hypothetical protein
LLIYSKQFKELGAPLVAKPEKTRAYKWKDYLNENKKEFYWHLLRNTSKPHNRALNLSTPALS